MHAIEPVVWTIAGFDPSGGAGILADVATLTTLKITGFGVTTAVSAQNGFEVTRLSPVSIDLLEAQINALKKLGWPKVIKIGLLPNAQIVTCVAQLLTAYPGSIVYDPVMSATCGHALIQSQTIHAIKSQLFQKITLLTPNIDEAERLTGLKINGSYDMLCAAKKICQLGVKQVILKGGHLPGGLAQDVWTNGIDASWLSLPRFPIEKTHGSGCIFSASLAAFLAQGYEILDAFVLAKMSVTLGIKNAFIPMDGLRFVRVKEWSQSACDFPWLTDSPLTVQPQSSFLPCENPLGFYPVVNSALWVQNCVSWGVRSIQLRLKENSKTHDEISQATKWVKNKGIQFFVNDDWELAIKNKAFGVHLGQEDLKTSDLSAIHKAGCRLGVSTHSYSELARALALQPSYIALGPIYPTLSKQMPFAPQGIATLKIWRELVTCPLVAIGGINLQNIQEVLSARVDSIAVISALSQAKEPISVCHQFLKILKRAESYV